MRDQRQRDRGIGIHAALTAATRECRVERLLGCGEIRRGQIDECHRYAAILAELPPDGAPIRDASGLAFPRSAHPPSSTSATSASAPPL
jgi:hypothetical protein